MAVDFPNSPAINDTFTSGDKTYVWTGTTWNLQEYGPAKGAFYAADTAPGSPLVGDVWYDTSVGKTYIRYDGYWIEVGNSGTIQATHADQHRGGGNDVIDGDRLQVDYVPSTYTRNAAASGATATTDLAAHLDGINSHFLRHHTATSAPSSPSAGWLWYDTNAGILKVYNGTSWVTAYPAGSVIQTVFTRSDTRTTYASNNSGNGTTITALNLTITPRFANSRIYCQWMINGELHQDNTFVIHKDGAIQTSPAGYNTSVGNIRSSGYASGFYDQNEDSTPSNWQISYMDTSLGSISSRVYAPAVRGSGASNYTLALNRTISGSTADNYESMVSLGVAMEIAV
jgi:hypothetical protein